MPCNNLYNQPICNPKVRGSTPLAGSPIQENLYFFTQNSIENFGISYQNCPHPAINLRSLKFSISVAIFENNGYLTLNKNKKEVEMLTLNQLTERILPFLNEYHTLEEITENLTKFFNLKEIIYLFIPSKTKYISLIKSKR